MKRWHKALILSLMGGDLYCMVELIWRGHTHWSMFLLAAMLSLPLDLANEHMAWERPLWLQALIGGSVITLAELGAGLILNVWLKLDIWDYSRLPGNLWGQVCLKYALLWVVLAGTASCCSTGCGTGCSKRSGPTTAGSERRDAGSERRCSAR